MHKLTDVMAAADAGNVNAEASVSRAEVRTFLKNMILSFSLAVLSVPKCEHPVEVFAWVCAIGWNRKMPDLLQQNMTFIFKVHVGYTLMMANLQRNSMPQQVRSL